MASALIHLAVAKKVNEQLKRDNRILMLGSVAPDISKQIGSSRNLSHFISNIGDIPDIDKFLSKYKKYLDNDFEIGYLIHLLTDVLWFKEFLSNYLNGDIITLKDGTKKKMNDDEFTMLIYNDYTDLNSKLIDYYNLDLSVFYDNYDLPQVYIEEIPKDNLNVIIDKMGTICSLEGKNKEYIITLEPVVHFIDYCVIYVLDYLNSI